ncbi:glycosyltransferase, partial [Klebsiella pneumoniae]
VPGVSRVFSRVPMKVTPDIYRSCDILVKLSTVEGMFGPPLEIFHCGGTAIVFDVTGHDEYIVDGQNACVVHRGDMDGVVTTLRRLLNDRTELARLQAGALKTAEAWVSWDASS